MALVTVLAFMLGQLLPCFSQLVLAMLPRPVVVQLPDFCESLVADYADMRQVFLLELILICVLRPHDAMTLSHVTIQAFLP